MSNRQVWPRDQVAHLWANRSQDSARDPHGNFYFTGRAIFSWGSHFIIAAHAELQCGHVILWNDQTYSSSTSRHQWIVRRALPSYLTRYGVDGLRDNDMRSRGWMLSLAQRVARDAAQCFDNAAGCVRASAKRSGYAHEGARYVETARVLAETVAAGVGDAKDASAADKRAARALLKTLDKVPAYPDDKAQQRDAMSTAALLLNRESLQRKMREHAATAARQFDNATHAASPDYVDYHRTGPDFILADRYANDAMNAADEARKLAKQYRFRCPKLPDIAAFRASIEPQYRAAIVERLEHHARKALQEMERGVRKMATNAQRPFSRHVSAYGVRRDAETVLDHASTADTQGMPHAVPAWMRERAQRVSDRMARRDAIEGAASDIAAPVAAETSGDSYRDAGHARDAVREYERAQKMLAEIIDALPVAHPAWLKLGNAAGCNAMDARLAANIATLRAQFAAEDAEKLAAWRSGESATFPRFYGNDSPALRLSKDGRNIESSWGAIVPVSVAPVLWRLVERARKSGERVAYRPSDDTRPSVGAFRLDRVDADGGLHVGCHHIAWDEVAHIAMRLGYINEAATV